MKLQIKFWILHTFQTSREHHYCGILVDFAIQLMTLLENINRDSFQRFRLRAGLNQVSFFFGKYINILEAKSTLFF